MNVIRKYNVVEFKNNSTTTLKRYEYSDHIEWSYVSTLDPFNGPIERKFHNDDAESLEKQYQQELREQKIERVLNEN
jgi:hypothetical protein